MPTSRPRSGDNDASEGGRGGCVPPTRPPDREIRAVREADLERAGAIDVSEEGDVVYQFVDGELRTVAESWQRPRPDREAFAVWRARSRSLLEPDVWLGAFVGGALAGLASLRYSLAGSTAQLTTLHVDRAYRRQGVGERLLNEVGEMALAAGARRLYVSATPSASAVTFYLRHGFEPTPEPDPRLFALEPEDIHMVLSLSPTAEVEAR